MSNLSYSEARLPYELFDAAAQSLDPAELRSWSQVCRHFAATAQKRLFSAVALEDGLCDPDHPITDATRAGTTFAFHRLLKEAPHLSKYVVSFAQDFRGSVEESTYDESLLIGASADILRSLCNLTDFHLKGSSYLCRLFSSSTDAFDVDLRQFLEETDRNIVSVILTETKGVASFDWIRHWSSVKEVTLKYPLMDDIDGHSSNVQRSSFVLEEQKPHLHSLTIEIDRSSSASKLTNILTVGNRPFTLDQLTRLNIKGVKADLTRNTVPFYNTLIAAGQLIENLTFAPPPVSYMINPNDSIPLDLSLSKNLKELRILSICFQIKTDPGSRLLNANLYHWITESTKTFFAIRKFMIVLLLISPGDFYTTAEIGEIFRSHPWSEMDETLDNKNIELFQIVIQSPSESLISDSTVQEIREVLTNMMPCLNERKALQIARLAPHPNDEKEFIVV